MRIDDYFHMARVVPRHLRERGSGERARLGRNDLVVMYNINAEFADPLDKRPIALRARSAVFSSLADIICVSGAMTGEGASASGLASLDGLVGDGCLRANPMAATRPRRPTRPGIIHLACRLR